VVRPVPVLGFLDDLILIPLGIAVVLKTIPPEVMAECREKAAAAMAGGKRRNWIAAGVIVTDGSCSLWPPWCSRTVEAPRVITLPKL
jgi:hypothetical protein